MTLTKLCRRAWCRPGHFGHINCDLTTTAKGLLRAGGDGQRPPCAARRRRPGASRARPAHGMGTMSQARTRTPGGSRLPAASARRRRRAPAAARTSHDARVEAMAPTRPPPSGGTQLARRELDVDFARLLAVGKVLFERHRLRPPDARRVGEPRPQPRHLLPQRVHRVIIGRSQPAAPSRRRGPWPCASGPHRLWSLHPWVPPRPWQHARSSMGRAALRGPLLALRLFPSIAAAATPLDRLHECDVAPRTCATSRDAERRVEATFC